jgi:hypothetical protein
VVVDSHREHSFGIFLANNILVQVVLDFLRSGDWFVGGIAGRGGIVMDVTLNHIVGFGGTGVTYIAAEAGEQ